MGIIFGTNLRTEIGLDCDEYLGSTDNFVTDLENHDMCGHLGMCDVLHRKFSRGRMLLDNHQHIGSVVMYAFK